IGGIIIRQPLHRLFAWGLPGTAAPVVLAAVGGGLPGVLLAWLLVAIVSLAGGVRLAGAAPGRRHASHGHVRLGAVEGQRRPLRRRRVTTPATTSRTGSTIPHINQPFMATSSPTLYLGSGHGITPTG